MPITEQEKRDLLKKYKVHIPDQLKDQLIDNAQQVPLETAYNFFKDPLKAQLENNIVGIDLQLADLQSQLDDLSLQKTSIQADIDKLSQE